MRRDLGRLGCDGCKDTKADTYLFEHPPKAIWICESCLATLLDWPDCLVWRARSKHIT